MTVFPHSAFPLSPTISEWFHSIWLHIAVQREKSAQQWLHYTLLLLPFLHPPNLGHSACLSLSICLMPSLCLSVCLSSSEEMRPMYAYDEASPPPHGRNNMEHSFIICRERGERRVERERSSSLLQAIRGGEEAFSGADGALRERELKMAPSYSRKGGPEKERSKRKEGRRGTALKRPHLISGCKHVGARVLMGRIFSSVAKISPGTMLISLPS